MKFAIYELWEAERATLEKMSQEYGFTYEVTKEILTLDNIHLCILVYFELQFQLLLLYQYNHLFHHYQNLDFPS